MKLRIVVLTIALCAGVAAVAPVIKADANSVFGEQLKDLDRRVTSMESLPSVVGEMKTDMAVFKDEMGQVTWLLRGLFFLVAGVVVERIAQNRKPNMVKLD